MARQKPRRPRARSDLGVLARRCHSEAELREQLRFWAVNRMKGRTGLAADDAETALRSSYRETEQRRSAALKAASFAREVKQILHQAVWQFNEDGEDTTSVAFMLALRLLEVAGDPGSAWLFDERDRSWQEWAIAKEQPVRWRVVAATLRIFRKPREPPDHPADERRKSAIPRPADCAAVHVLTGHDLPGNWSKREGITISQAIESLKTHYKDALRICAKKAASDVRGLPKHTLPQA
jgi:hypothetical protein